MGVGETLLDAGRFLDVVVPGWQSGNAPASRSTMFSVGQSAGGPLALKGSNPFPGANNLFGLKMTAWRFLLKIYWGYG